MARAGFWPVGGYKISFRKDGHWYADDDRIPNARIARLFSRHLCPDGNGGWVIDVGIDRHPVTVEDTPLVVRRIDGDAENGFQVRTNDGVSSSLDCTTLEIGDGDVLYCTVDRGDKRGRMKARFLRPAYYELARYIDFDGDMPVLHCRGRQFPVEHHHAA
ncbi:MAG TPA: hypothetical protein VEC57_14215 [Candidatus Limnocylindrales bacterium]|nr:hypothetical protein [Candidatus Limnocylindrales bacterium]